MTIAGCRFLGWVIVFSRDPLFTFNLPTRTGTATRARGATVHSDVAGVRAGVWQRHERIILIFNSFDGRSAQR